MLMLIYVAVVDAEHMREARRDASVLPLPMITDDLPTCRRCRFTAITCHAAAYADAAMLLMALRLLILCLLAATTPDGL